jgi:hypothetical protein
MQVEEAPASDPQSSTATTTATISIHTASSIPMSYTPQQQQQSIRTSGTVKFFNSQKGYGFIIPQEGELEGECN